MNIIFNYCPSDGWGKGISMLWYHFMFFPPSVSLLLTGHSCFLPKGFSYSLYVSWIMNTLSTVCAENIFPHLWLFTIMGFFFLNIQSFIFLGIESLNLFLYSCWVFTSWGSLPHSISLKALLSGIILENTDNNICNTHNVLCPLYKNQTFNFGKTDLIWTIIFSSYNKQ